MIEKAIEFFTNPFKTAITSLVSAFAGTMGNYISYFSISFISLDTINTAFQHAAWVVAIGAGLVSIVNGVKGWRMFKRKRVRK